MINFDYYMPTKLLFGAGKVSEIGKITKKYGKRALLVTGKNSTKRTGLLDKAISCLQNEGVESFVFDKVQSNPITTIVEEGVSYSKENHCDVIIALGGGSAIDTAKSIAFMAVNEGDINEYIYGKFGIGALPIIAVTTTAGTGSEGNCFAVLTNPKNNDKKSLKSLFLYPKVSIVDPELMTTLPKHIIASTGIDVLCHAMEGYVAKNSNPISELMALKAMELISENLVEVYKDPQNVKAWSGMVLANTLGGMVIDASGVALAHGIEHPVSGLLDVAHGEGLAAIIITWMEYSYENDLEKFASIAKALREDVEGLSLRDSAEKSIEAVNKLLNNLNLTKKLSELGVRKEHIDWLANNAVKTMVYAIGNNPKVLDLVGIKKMYFECLY